MVLQKKIKNATFSSIIDETMKQHFLPVSKYSSLNVVLWALPSFWDFLDFNVSSEVFELMTSALAHIKCQVIFYNTSKDKMWYSVSFGILSFYVPPLELVHRVELWSKHKWASRMWVGREQRNKNWLLSLPALATIANWNKAGYTAT